MRSAGLRSHPLRSGTVEIEAGCAGSVSRGIDREANGGGPKSCAAVGARDRPRDFPEVDDSLVLAETKERWPQAHAAGVRAPFDHNSGWRIAPIAYRLMPATDDPQIQAKLTTALGEPPDDI